MHADGRADARFDVAVEGFDGLVEFEGGADGACRIVLVGYGVAEDGQDGVAQELADAAVVAGDDLACALPDLVDDVAHVLGIEAFVEGGKAFEVGEEDGDLAALLAGGGGRRVTAEWRGALAAETGVFGCGGATLGACYGGRRHSSLWLAPADFRRFIPAIIAPPGAVTWRLA